MTERSRFSLDGNFHGGKLSVGWHEKQIFLQNEGIQAVRIVMRQGFHELIPMSLVERDRGPIIDSSFQSDVPAADCPQALFRCRKQSRTQARTPRRRKHINGDDMTGAMMVGVSHHKT